MSNLLCFIALFLHTTVVEDTLDIFNIDYRIFFASFFYRLYYTVNYGYNTLQPQKFFIS